MVRVWSWTDAPWMQAAYDDLTSLVDDANRAAAARSRLITGT
jgi:hypothetical protein